MIQDQLLTLDNEQMRPMPEWARAFLDLGTQFANHPAEAPLLTLAVLTPSKHYASVLAAAGVIANYYTNPQDNHSSSEHINHLKTLTNGNIVKRMYPSGNVRNLRFISYEPNSGEFVFQETSKGANSEPTYQRFHENQQAQILESITSSTEEVADLPVNPRMQTPIRNTPFIANLIGEENLQSFQAENKNLVRLVSEQQKLKSELSTEFATKSQDDVLNTSKLEELVRVRELSNRKNFLYNTTQFNTSINSTSGNYDENSNNHILTIFDGSRAYLNRKDDLEGTHRLIILPRTDSALQDAIDEINIEYMYAQERDTNIHFQYPYLEHCIFGDS